jgi:hypothetical protein
MVSEARRKFPDHADAFFVADMRWLPRLGEFDLILCLDDAVNYLLSEDDLRATFTGVAGLLARDGVFAFDVNSLNTYRGPFAQALVRETDGLFFSWCGEAKSEIESGGLASAMVEVFAERRDGLWERRSSHHIQRHHPTRIVLAALERAGLECCALAGQLPGAQLETSADEDRHIKLVYFARRARDDAMEGGDRRGDRLAVIHGRAGGGHLPAPIPRGPRSV